MAQEKKYKDERKKEQKEERTKRQEGKVKKHKDKCYLNHKYFVLYMYINGYSILQCINGIDFITSITFMTLVMPKLTHLT